FGLWTVVLVPKYWPPRPLPAAATNAPLTTLAATNQGPLTSAVSPSRAEAPVIPPRPLPDTNVPEELLVLTNDNARYTFTSHGGGLKLIELVRYPESVST